MYNYSYLEKYYSFLIFDFSFILEHPIYFELILIKKNSKKIIIKLSLSIFHYQVNSAETS